jgi:hypothetical protein
MSMVAFSSSSLVAAVCLIDVGDGPSSSTFILSLRLLDVEAEVSVAATYGAIIEENIISFESLFAAANASAAAALLSFLKSNVGAMMIYFSVVTQVD